MADNSFTKFVPGFDFLQGLVKNAGAALPGMGQWVAPTLNPEELEKRIEELRTVQFWLEQNARMLGATIQALEVQRMTLSTLKSMNVPLAELRDSLKVATPKAQAEPEPEAEAEEKPAAPAAVDPMQWWSALSQQFTQLATTAMKDSATDAAKNLAGNLVKQSFEAAGETLRKTAAMPGALAKKAATQTAARPAAKKKPPPSRPPDRANPEPR
ncbi:hypothetical protein PEC18_26415 [Paucibacter sp. O1-1]|nr:hypothetical protein [Paucibacter sp. O1-1]MDA3829275.1 hypothetical protein [Paucibacter sp. O1-1]